MRDQIRIVEDVLDVQVERQGRNIHGAYSGRLSGIFEFIQGALTSEPQSPQLLNAAPTSGMGRNGTAV
jgi:hypothetical protein